MFYYKHYYDYYHYFKQLRGFVTQKRFFSSLYVKKKQLIYMKVVK